MNMNKKMMIMNLVFLFIFLFLGYLVATTRFSPPEHEVLATGTAGAANPAVGEGTSVESETSYTVTAAPRSFVAEMDKYPAFGAANIFDTIIAKPTIPPTPTRTQPPDPRLDDVVSQWKLTSIFENTATFNNVATKKDWTMKVGETVDESYRGQSYSIKLDKVDEDNLQVVISFKTQTKTIGMF
jgi:hypothetical protein